MANFTGTEQAHCAFWLKKTKSATQAQRNVCTEYHKDPPSRPSTSLWHKNFCETVYSVHHTKKASRPSTSAEMVEQREFCAKSTHINALCI
jgi:hypothetical protein